MNNSEQIKYIYEKLVDLENIIFELKVEIEQLKYFNSELRFHLPDIK